MHELQTATSRSNAGAFVTACVFVLAMSVIAMTSVFIEAQAQARRRGRLQKKIEKLEQRGGTNKLNSSGGTGSVAGDAATGSALNGQPEPALPKTSAQPEQAGRHSLDGIRDKGIRGIFREEERELIIPGVGNPVALIMIFRQLDLTGQQKQEIKAIRRRIGNRLNVLQNEHRQLDAQLTEAIYGENFDPKRVEELAAQVAEKQSEIIKLRASVEAQLRQVMTPDQFYVFHFLVGEMVMPQRRVPPAQLRQMLQRRMGQPGRPNQQNPPQM